MKISRPETMSGKIRHLENICENICSETEVRISHTKSKSVTDTQRTEEDRGQT